ncbi:hypothetical protein QYF36_007858 [Acer negundo]|nr:hypothetical protein QYF36_007858 [Acer negundo]
MQWFEQTSALAKLKAHLLQTQKKINWSTNCHKIGYASRSNKKVINASADKDGLHRIRPSSYLDDTESQQVDYRKRKKSLLMKETDRCRSLEAQPPLTAASIAKLSPLTVENTTFQVRFSLIFESNQQRRS